MEGAIVGAGCNIGYHAFVESGARLGDRVTVKNAVLIWDRVTVEDEVVLGPTWVFTNDLAPRAARRKSPEEFPSTVVKRGATPWDERHCGCGTTIGERAFVATGAVVTWDVAPFALVAGNPARHMGVGLRLRRAARPRPILLVWSKVPAPRRLEDWPGG
jgi:UDP-2-acetamido-3-amino-2,3-dideoxy-glucuronate N-acetyltransferase